MAENPVYVDMNLNGNEIKNLKDPSASTSGANKFYVDSNDQNSTNSYAVASGTNTYAASFTPALTSYTAGQFLKVLFTNANTGAATININGLGAKTLVKFGGTALVGGEIYPNQIITIAYDGTNFQIFSGIQGATGSGVNINVYDEGTPVAGTPHSILNYTGPGIQATNAGAGQANIFVPGVDRQEVRSAALFTTASAAYADLTAMTLTTKSLGANGNYIVIFNANITTSNNSSSGFFILNVNGADIAATEISQTPGNTGKHNLTLVATLPSITSGIIIKVRSRIQPGGGGTPTLTVYERSLTINGVNINTIVP